MVSRLCVGLVMIVALLSAGGCTAKVTGSREPGADFNKIRSMYVIKNKDSVVSEPIEQELTKRNFKVTSGDKESAPKDVDCIVDWKAKWMWDITTYLLEFKVDFIDGKTGALLASGRSYRTSGKRKPAEYMVHEVLEKIFAEPPATKPKTPK
jgi:hypothetical protein